MKKKYIYLILAIILISVVTAGTALLTRSDTTIELTDTDKTNLKIRLGVETLNINRGETECSEGYCINELYNTKTQEICDERFISYITENRPDLTVNKKGCYVATVESRLGNIMFQQVADNELKAKADEATTKRLKQLAVINTPTRETKLGNGTISIQ